MGPSPTPGKAFAQSLAYALALTNLFYHFGVVQTLLGLLPREDYRARMYETAVVIGCAVMATFIYLYSAIYTWNPRWLYPAQTIAIALEGLLFNVNVSSLPDEFNAEVAHALEKEEGKVSHISWTHLKKSI